MKILIPIAALVLAGCEASLPVLDPPHTGCQVRAGVISPSGSASGGFARGSIEGSGAAVTVIGSCQEDWPADLHVFSRSPGGGWLCKGSVELCRWALENAPVTMSRQQYDALIELRPPGAGEARE